MDTRLQRAKPRCDRSRLPGTFFTQFICSERASFLFFKPFWLIYQKFHRWQSECETLKIFCQEFILDFKKDS